MVNPYNMMYPYQQPVIREPVAPQGAMPAPMTQNDPMIWVQGEEEMKSYRVAPNATVPLWDSEKQTIYLKSAEERRVRQQLRWRLGVDNSAPASRLG